MKKIFNKIASDISTILGWQRAEDVYEKAQFILTIILQLVFIAAFIWAFFEPQWNVMFVSFLGMVCIWLPLFFAKSRRVYVPIEFIFLFTLFIYAALFLGEIRSFYERFWWWDMLLHAFFGLAIGFIGFLILYSLYKNKRIVISDSLLAFFSFTFVMTLGVIWEIFEFAMDSFFGLNMQRTETGVVDTMKDFILNTLGALVASVSGYFYLKHQKKGIGVFRHYLEAYFERNELDSKENS